MTKIFDFSEVVNRELKEGLKKVPHSHTHCETNLVEKREELIRQFQNDDIVKAYSDRVIISEKYIQGIEDDVKVRIKIYEPKNIDDVLPGLFHIHGGGYIVGNADMMDAECCELVDEIGCVIVAADYRLAPEYPYPAPLNDCYAALKWFSDNASELRVNTEKIAVYGESAGGGLAAAVALLARDKGYPKICFQVPLCPMIDDRCETQSSNEVEDLRSWNATTNRYGWKAYLGDLYGSDDVPYYAAPARAEDLSGLPEAYICVGSLDPFRDENIEYVSKLSKAGVPTEFHLYPGCFHGYAGAIPDAEISKRYFKGFKDALKRALK